jgi:hypothetical protein
MYGAQGDPAILQIRILEGEGLAYAAGSRATRGITIQVTDETGKPVEGVSVSFRLPEDGPGGVFSSGSKTEVATTRSDGQATVWGMQWNRNTGSFEVRITAAKGDARAGTTCPLYISDVPSARSVERDSRVGSGASHKWIWIALAAAGAAGAGIAAASNGKSTSTTATGPEALKIGTPGVVITHP